MKIGVLALQGNFEIHRDLIEKLGLVPVLIRYPNQLDKVEGLIIPGGESTTLTKLMENNFFYDPLVAFAGTNSILGTCAGLIMLAKRVYDPRIKPLRLIDISITRNRYGSQVNSFSQSIPVKLGDMELVIPATFIRAPKIEKIGPTVEILAVYNNDVVAVREKNHLGIAFHPEMDNVSVFHEWLFNNPQKSNFRINTAISYAA
ncbi:pyridoxal 5'-phosphate synthase glutaminase subunit PdxT [Candidatus Neomarinimicrobiota bacterium]